MVDNLDPEDLTATQKVWTDGTKQIPRRLATERDENKENTVTALTNVGMHAKMKATLQSR